MNELVEEWLAKAEEDWAAARILLADDCPPVTPSLFHMQQCAEKLLKALLIKKEIPFERRHDLSYLLHLSGESVLKTQSNLLSALNPFAVEIRYPGDLPQFSVNEASLLLNDLGEFRDSLIHLIHKK